MLQNPIRKTKRRALKETLLSKAFWASVALTATGISLCVAGEWKEGLPSVFLGLMGMFGRHSVSKLGNATAILTSMEKTTRM